MLKVNQPEHKLLINSALIKFILAFGILYIFSLSPVLLIIACLAYFSLSRNNNLIIQFIFSLLLLYSFSLIYSSREVGFFLDDFSNQYYPWYIYAKNNSFSEYFITYPFKEGFSFYIEFGFNIFIFLLSKLPFYFNINELIFIVTFFTSGIFFIWLRLALVPKVPEKYKNLALMVGLVFFSYGLASQLTRQMLSSVFLLFYLFPIHEKRNILYLILSTTFHFTGIVVAAIYFYIKITRLWGLLVLLGTVALFQIFGFIIFSIIDLPFLQNFDKLDFYRSESQNILTTDFSTLYLTFILCFAAFFTKEYWNHNLFFLSMAFVLLYILLLPLPLASFRITLLLTTCLFGPIIILFLIENFDETLARIGALFISCIWVIRRLPILESSNFSAWTAFDLIYFIPFRHFYEIFG